MLVAQMQALAALAVLATAASEPSPAGGACPSQASAQDLQLMQHRFKRFTAARWTALVDHGSDIRSGSAIFLTASNGNRISVNGTSVFAEWDHYGSWERLLVEKRRGGGPIHSEDIVRLTAHTNRVISVNGTKVVAAFTAPEADELQIVRRGGPGKLKAGDAVNLRAYNGMLVGVNASKVVAMRTMAEEPETFVVDGYAGEEEATETVTTTPRLAAEGNWHVEDVGECDAELGCHRDRVVLCKAEDGSRLHTRDCDPHTRPPSYEACITLGQGSCIDIAESDCLDVPGCWWNRWRKTCDQLVEAGACSNLSSAPAGLEGWQDGDAAMVQKACVASCGLCTAHPDSAPSYVDSSSCAEGACEDDVVYRTPFGSGCFRWTGRDCDSVFFSADLKVACPKACGLCGS